MDRARFLAAALAFSVFAIPVLTSAQQTDALSIAFFEKNKVVPRDTAKLRATISDRTISIRTLEGGAIEQVYYGTQRIDAKGRKTKYQIGKAGLEEEHDRDPRMLLIYDWHSHAYVCLANVGDLDVLGDAEGTCPYEIVATTQGNHVGGK